MNRVFAIALAWAGLLAVAAPVQALEPWHDQMTAKWLRQKAAQCAERKGAQAHQEQQKTQAGKGARK